MCIVLSSLYYPSLYSDTGLVKENDPSAAVSLRYYTGRCMYGAFPSYPHRNVLRPARTCGNICRQQHRSGLSAIVDFLRCHSRIKKKKGPVERFLYTQVDRLSPRLTLQLKSTNRYILYNYYSLFEYHRGGRLRHNSERSTPEGSNPCH